MTHAPENEAENDSNWIELAAAVRNVVTFLETARVTTQRAELKRESVALNGAITSAIADPMEAAGNLSDSRPSRQPTGSPPIELPKEETAADILAGGHTMSTAAPPSAKAEAGEACVTAGHIAASAALPDGAVSGKRSPRVFDPGSWMPRPSRKQNEVAALSPPVTACRWLCPRLAASGPTPDSCGVVDTNDARMKSEHAKSQAHSVCVGFSDEDDCIGLVLGPPKAPLRARADLVIALEASPEGLRAVVAATNDKWHGASLKTRAVSPTVTSINSDVAGKTALATPTRTTRDATAQSPALASGSFARDWMTTAADEPGWRNSAAVVWLPGWGTEKVASTVSEPGGGWTIDAGSSAGSTEEQKSVDCDEVRSCIRRRLRIVPKLE